MRETRGKGQGIGTVQSNGVLMHWFVSLCTLFCYAVFLFWQVQVPKLCEKHKMLAV